MEVWIGSPYPLGATWDGSGVNFALFSENATGVELCIYDGHGESREIRIPVHDQADQVWYLYLPDARPGLLYGYRVYGPLMHRRKATASTLPSSSTIHTPRQSAEPYDGMTPCMVISKDIRMPISPGMTGTVSLINQSALL